MEQKRFSGCWKGCKPHLAVLDDSAQGAWQAREVQEGHHVGVERDLAHAAAAPCRQEPQMQMNQYPGATLVHQRFGCYEVSRFTTGAREQRCLASHKTMGKERQREMMQPVSRLNVKNPSAGRTSADLVSGLDVAVAGGIHLVAVEVQQLVQAKPQDGRQGAAAAVGLARLDHPGIANAVRNARRRPGQADLRSRGQDDLPAAAHQTCRQDTQNYTR